MSDDKLREEKNKTEFGTTGVVCLPRQHSSTHARAPTHARAWTGTHRIWKYSARCLPKGRPYHPRHAHPHAPWCSGGPRGAAPLPRRAGTDTGAGDDDRRRRHGVRRRRADLPDHALRRDPDHRLGAGRGAWVRLPCACVRAGVRACRLPPSRCRSSAPSGRRGWRCRRATLRLPPALTPLRLFTFPSRSARSHSPAAAAAAAATNPPPRPTSSARSTRPRPR